jgi:hypothetical protein
VRDWELMIGGAEGDRTPDLMTASAIRSTALGDGSYDLLTFVTGCSRQRVHQLSPIQASFAVVLSQVCRNCELCLNGPVCPKLCLSPVECLAN